MGHNFTIIIVAMNDGCGVEAVTISLLPLIISGGSFKSHHNCSVQFFAFILLSTGSF